MAVRATYTSMQVEEAKFFGISPETYVRIWEETWDVPRGPRLDEWERPGPTVFRSKTNGMLWRVYFYHDGCPITMEKVEGD